MPTGGCCELRRLLPREDVNDAAGASHHTVRADGPDAGLDDERRVLDDDAHAVPRSRLHRSELRRPPEGVEEPSSADDEVGFEREERFAGDDAAPL